MGGRNTRLGDLAGKDITSTKNNLRGQYKLLKKQEVGKEKPVHILLGFVSEAANSMVSVTLSANRWTPMGICILNLPTDAV